MKEAQAALSRNTFDVILAELKSSEEERWLDSTLGADSALSAIVLTSAREAQIRPDSRHQDGGNILTIPCQAEVIRGWVRYACTRTQLLRENVFLKDRVAHLEALIECTYVLSGNGKSLVRAHDSPKNEDRQLADDVFSSRVNFNGTFDLTAVLERTEKDLILRTISAAGGVQAEAACRMGLSRSTLAYKLNKYRIRLTDESMRELYAPDPPLHGPA